MSDPSSDCFFAQRGAHACVTTFLSRKWKEGKTTLFGPHMHQSPAADGRVEPSLTNYYLIFIIKVSNIIIILVI